MATQPDSGPPASARPTGTVTFVFSDIEGSTQRWDRDRAAMQDAVRRHDALMRTAIAAHDGYVFKTIGDAFCAAFARPQDAVAAILDAQLALGAEDFSRIDGLRVRAAVHTGTADERDGDYYGPALNRVARLMSIGHGGQVLVSGITTDLVQGTLPSQTSLCDLGEHRLKDLARPERVYQLLAPDLVTEFPPLRSLDVLPNNLPRQLNTFVGREAEVAAVGALIEKSPLVTLVGSAGVGKTRLSLQVAANLLDGFGDGVWFIELAPLTSGDYIPSTVALPLELTLAPEGDPVENVVRVLKTKHMLLVFDNCEHLVEPAARAISAILHGCPKVKVLVSSRQGLGVAGEATYQVPSLALPAKDAPPPTTIDLLRYESVALFVDRAVAASDKFSLNDDNASMVADICRRLDGIPLAIELAAARVKMLSPKQLRERLEQRFRVLTGGSRDVLPRQQTMRALIDWSHDLLDERERALFRRLGIFVNGFELSGAVGAGSGDDLEELDVFDVLASLVDKSLVLAEPDGGTVRYRLLESTRAYALEKLGDAGESGLVAGRHLRYLRDRFADLRERILRTARGTLSATLQTELEDVRAALDGALARSEVMDGGELLASIDTSWQAVGLDAEGMARCEAYLAALPADQSRLRARLSTALSGLFSQSLHQLRAFELATQAVEHARASGDDSSLALALNRYAFTATLLDRLDDAEEALAEKALTQAEAIPAISPFLRVELLITRALLSQTRGDLETAAHVHEELRKESRSLGNPRGEQIAAINLAVVEHRRGQTQRAIAISREVLPPVRSGADKNLFGILLNNLAEYLAAAGDLPGVAAAAREALGIRAAREPDHVGVAIAIEHLALVFALRGDVVRAATLEGYANPAFARHGFPRELTEATTHDRLTALLPERLSPDELARLSAEGAALTPEAAIALALEEQ
ncbi:MAG TPA: adenylate/guanylate cyclase domain-containing protein [Candidatus Cybelea sp.]|nr:adenylate/guanylate cyclase domain-containing protein [Candidatus Cybelea sp.]